MSGSRLRWMVAGAALLAVAFFSPWKVGFDENRTYMESSYIDYGETLIHHLPPQENPSCRMPLPTVLAVVVFSHPKLEARHWKWGCFIIISLLILASGALLGSMRGALLTLLIWGMAGSSELITDFPQTFYTPLVLIVAGLLILRARQPSLTLTAAASLAIGASLLCRSPLALFPPVLLAFERVFGGPSRKSRLDAALLCFVPYLPLIPWVWMNWVLHGRLVLFEDGATNDNMVAGVLGLIGAVEGDARVLLPAIVDADSNSALLRWALTELTHHPLRYAWAVGGRLLYTASLHPVVAALGSWAAWRYRRQAGVRVLALLAVYFVAVHCALAVQENYFYPLWPLLSLLAGTLSWSFLLPKGVTASPSRASTAVIWGLSATAFGLCTLALIVSVRYGLAAQRGFPPMRAALDSAIARAPGENWLLFRRGQERLHDNDLEGAAGDFAGAAWGEPPLSRAWFRLQWALTLLGRPNELLEAPFPQGDWEDSYYIWCRYIETRLMRAFALQRKSRRLDAERELRLAVAAYGSLNLVRGPDTSQGQAARARLASGNERLFIDNALDLLRGQLLEDKIGFYELMRVIFPKDPAIRQAGEGLLQKVKRARKTPRLLVALDHLVEKMPMHDQQPLLGKAKTEAVFLLERTELLLNSGSIEEARSLLSSIERLPLDVPERLRAIRLCAQVGAYALALRLQEPLMPAPGSGDDFWLERAKLQQGSGDKLGALQSLARINDLSTSPERLHESALLYQALGAPDEAERHLRRLVEREPEKGRYQADLGIILFTMGRLTESAFHLGEALRLDPGDLSASLSLASVYLAQGRVEQAADIRKQALEGPCRKPPTDPRCGLLKSP